MPTAPGGGRRRPGAGPRRGAGLGRGLAPGLALGLLPALIVGLIAGLAAPPAGAIVPVALRPTAALPAGLSGEAAADLAGSQGNARTLAAGLDLALRHRRGGRALLLLGSEDYGRSLGRRDADRSFLHLRRIAALAPPRPGRWRPAWELLAQGQRDAFRRLRLRLLAGGGLRWERPRAVAGLGLLRVLESYRATAGSPARRRPGWRLNLYAGLHRRWGRPSRPAALEAALYWQPRLGAPADFQALGQLRLLAPLGRRLDLSLGLEAGHDSRPQEGVLRTDLRYRSGLRLRF